MRYAIEEHREPLLDRLQAELERRAPLIVQVVQQLHHCLPSECLNSQSSFCYPQPSRIQNTRAVLVAWIQRSCLCDREGPIRHGIPIAWCAGVGQIIVVPAGPPVIVGRIAGVGSFGRLKVAIGKEKVGQVIVPVGRPFSRGVVSARAP